MKLRREEGTYVPRVYRVQERFREIVLHEGVHDALQGDLLMAWSYCGMEIMVRFS
jgi:hypothetical protein